MVNDSSVLNAVRGKSYTEGVFLLAAWRCWSYASAKDVGFRLVRPVLVVKSRRRKEKD